VGEPQAPTGTAAFLFTTCQAGAEAALKAEIAREHPGFHFAYSRPGFVTFKLPPKLAPAPDFDLRSVFARAWGYSLGKVSAESTDEAAAAAWKLAGAERYEALHVWQRDLAPIGFRGFEPHITPAAVEAEAAMRRAAELHAQAGELAQVAQPGQLALDCILVEPHEWWIGRHWAAADDSRFAGGMRPLDVPAEMISRAYLKMQEALGWSKLPVRPGDTIAEIGCAPGGASQALLDRGLKVLGIDPAQVDPRIAEHPGFTHVRKRGSEVRRREFRRVRWLAADMNVAPQYTLDTVEAIVTHPTVDVRGLLLTLKLPGWQLAAEVPTYLERVRRWGYGRVQARQLAHNRQEICVAALKRGKGR
jgi:23S rRNA (cytidine2498-2'-O)-methyltransferase